MGKLVLIDGNAIMHRAYHALPKNLTTRKGEPINAVYGFVSMLLRVISDLQPTHVAVCFDRKEPTFRKKEFVAYQAHRPETEKDLVSQFGKAKKTVESFGIPIYEKAGYEADDLIGTIVHLAQAAKNKKQHLDKIVIVTGDKDILQLVNNKVSVYLPNRGIVDGNLYGVEEVVLKMGVAPEQIVDYKGLVGDPSDNYPGVYGIGPKTAVNLLLKYDSFDEVYKNIDSVNPSVAKKLKAGRDNGFISRKLAKIITNADIEPDFDAMKGWIVGSDKTVDLFDEFGFRTLTRRVKDVGNKLRDEKQGNLF